MRNHGIGFIRPANDSEPERYCDLDEAGDTAWRFRFLPDSYFSACAGSPDSGAESLLYFQMLISDEEPEEN